MLDVHTHFFARGLVAPSTGAIAEGWPVVADVGERAEVYQRGKLMRVLGPSAWDPEVRIRELDRLGVEAQVVMPTPFTFLYDADPEVAIAYARAQNDALAEFVAAGRGRFYGLGALPLQAPDEAIAEAGRLLGDLGMHGAEIGTHAGLWQLHDPQLDPVLGALEALGAAVFVHPWQPLAPERTGHGGLSFGLGRVVETELAVGSLLAGGCLDRHPDLRICLAHAGGGVPSIRGRLANGWARQEETNRLPAEDPRQVLRRLWADGLAYDAMALALAEDTFGPDRMVVGTDFPFAAQESSVGASYADAAAKDILRLGADWVDRTTRNARAFLGTAR